MTKYVLKYALKGLEICMLYALRICRFKKKEVPNIRIFYININE